MRYDSFHPALVFLFFISTIFSTFLFRHPLWVGVSWLCAAFYLTGLQGKKGLRFVLILFPLSLLFGLWYASYHHFGVTVLFHNAIGNAWTLESLIYGWVLGFTFSACMFWLGCMHVLVKSDQILYLLGRISPRLSLFASVLFRFVPRIKSQFRKIDLAQQALGRSWKQGNPWQRLCHLLRILSMVITWVLESLLTISDSMRSRGVTLKGRTAFALWTLDGASLKLLLLQCFFLVLMVLSFLLGQTRMYYDPRLILPPFSPVGLFLLLCYLLYGLHPLLLQLWMEHSHENQIRKGSEK